MSNGQLRMRVRAASGRRRGRRCGAIAELTARHATDGAEEPTVSVAEWLAEHTAATRAEDPYRAVTDEAELADVAERRAADRDTLDETRPPADTVETDVPDLRGIAAAEPAPVQDDRVCGSPQPRKLPTASPAHNAPSPRSPTGGPSRRRTPPRRPAASK